MLKKALAIAEGRAEPAAVFTPETVDVAAIRKNQNLSQTETGSICQPVRLSGDSA